MLGLACGDNSSTATTIARPELIAVSPADFLGAFPCEQGAVQSYVATLFDVTPDATGKAPNPGLQLASSPATSCLAPVTFSFVLNERYYRAEVDAYRRTPAELVPLALGARLQLDAAGNRVLPDWVARCYGYPTSEAIDAGAPDASPQSSAGSSNADSSADDGGEAGTAIPPGVISYSALTQIPHNCGNGLAPFAK